MNLFVVAIVSVVLVYGKAFSHSICPAGFSMDKGSKICWNVTALILGFEECRTALPEVQESVLGVLGALKDIERKMHRLEDKNDANRYVSNNSNKVGDHLQNNASYYHLEGNSTEIHGLHSEQVLNGTTQYGSDKQLETSYRPHLSVATNLMEDEQNPQIIEFLGDKELDEPITVLSPEKTNRNGKKQSTPIPEFPPLDGSKDGENRIESMEEENTLKSSGEGNLDVGSTSTEITPKETSACSLEQNRIRQLEYDIALQKEKNDEYVVTMFDLEHSVKDFEERFEYELERRSALLSEELKVYVSQIEDLKEKLMKERSMKNECEALQEEAEEEMKQIGKTLNRLRFQRAQHEEMVRDILSVNEMNLEELASQKKLIENLRAEIYSLKKPHIGFDDSDDIEDDFPY